MKRVVVFGGAGFIGSYMVDHLLSHGCEVTSFDLRPHPSLSDKYNIVGDVLDAELVSSAVEGADIVFNYAAIADIEECNENPFRAVQINILGNTTVLDACVAHGVRRYMFASSVYTESSLGGVYSTSKRACESLIKDYSKYHGLDYTILRYGTVYGPGSDENNSVYRFVNEALADKKIRYQGTGEERREYIHALDAAALSFSALEKRYLNTTTTLTGHKSLKVKDLFAIIKEILNDEEIEFEFVSERNKKLLKSHYKTTPYSYSRGLPTKLVGTQYIDIGAGLLQCIREQDEQNR